MFVNWNIYQRESGVEKMQWQNMCIGGAAEVLNVPPSTVKSKTKKPGIRKEDLE
jgi:hypothetical protein